MDSLIYGKNEIQGIVSIEVHDKHAVLFIQQPDGTIRKEIVDNRYWLVSKSPLPAPSVTLKGELPYRYGKTFQSRSDFMRMRMRTKGNSFSIFNAKESLMVKDGYTYYKGLKHGDVSALSFDIETTGLHHDASSKVLIISNTFRLSKTNECVRKLFCYDDFESTKEMLTAWCDWVREINPSIMLGHNIFMYDLPYLSFIAKNCGMGLKLGRDNSMLWYDDYESKYRKDGSQFYHYMKAHIYGREIVDTMFTAIRYDVGRKYESYGLKSIVHAEGFEKEDRQFYDASKIRFMYQDPAEWAKIKQYAADDTDDALAVYDLTTPPIFYLTQTVPKPYELMLQSASGSQINSVMIRAYLQDKHSLPMADEAAAYEGGISMGNPGVYRNVFKVDVASLYPNIMLHHEVYDPVKDPQRKFLELVKTFTARRLEHKKLAKKDKYYDDLQSSEKIFINSCYGFLGSAGLLFNSPPKAALVTQQGRSILSRSISWAEHKGFRIVNADTDSISFTRQDGMEISSDERSSLLNDLNSLFPEQIQFEDDGYYSTVIVIAAKNYVMFDGDKVKYKGSALKATTKEPALKEFINDVIQEIFEASAAADHTSTLKEIYDKYAREINNLKDIKRWATRKTVTEKVLKAGRTMEKNVLASLQGSEYSEGDRVYLFFLPDGALRLAEQFNGEYDRIKLLEKLYLTAKIFDSVLDVKSIFPNYKLKRNKELLNTLWTSQN